MTVTFDPASHTYRDEWGEYIPSVTRILGDVFPFRGRTRGWYAEKGRAVHRVCDLEDRGVLDEKTVDDRIWPYLEAWRAFKRAFHPSGDKPVVIDIKSGSRIKDSHECQVAGYATALAEMVHSPGFNPGDGIEVIVWSEIFQYAGRLDRLYNAGSLTSWSNPEDYILGVVYLHDTGRYGVFWVEDDHRVSEWQKYAWDYHHKPEPLPW